MMNETWKTATYNDEVFNGYEVSDKGNVRNVKTGKVLKTKVDKGGYVQVGLYKDGKQKWLLVHRMVGCTFIPNDDVTKTEVNHINEDKTDNSVENLNWMSPKENSNWGTRNERIAKTKIENGTSKKIIGKSLNGNKVIVLKNGTQAKKFGFDQGSISKCCNGKLRQHHGYTWKYLD